MTKLEQWKVMIRALASNRNSLIGRNNTPYSIGHSRFSMRDMMERANWSHRDHGYPVGDQLLTPDDQARLHSSQQPPVVPLQLTSFPNSHKRYLNEDYHPCGLFHCLGNTKSNRDTRNVSKHTRHRVELTAARMAEIAPFTLDAPTVLSIGFALSFMPIAFGLAVFLIPANQKRNRVLFFWHAYDALTHLFIEGSYLYQCFFSYTTVPSGVLREPYFLGYKDRLYGAAYGTGPSARLWQEYAKADHRWAVADATVISLELLTVFLGGPTAVYICYLLYQASNSKASAQARGAAKSKLWLVAPALATAELYGGWMTFAPEWLTGSTQLETGHPVYLWLYLVFFNTLWVYVPLWVLWEAAKELKKAFVAAESTTQGKKKA